MAAHLCGTPRVDMCIVPMEPREGLGCPGAGVTCGCEPLDVGAGNQMWMHWIILLFPKVLKSIVFQSSLVG